MTETTLPTSPRIQEFRNHAARDLHAATDALKRSLHEARGPLIELLHEPLGESPGEPGSAPGGDGAVLVTFVWIGRAQRVSVRGAQIFRDLLAPSHDMIQIEGTDVWYLSTTAPANVTTVYQYLVDEPRMSADVMSDPAEALRKQLACAQADPYNPKRIYPQAGIIIGDDDVPESRWESILELPGAEPIEWFDDRGAPAGTLTAHCLRSAALGNERTVTVYLPPGYASTGEPYPLVVMLDGECWPRVARLHIGLDNLIAAAAITPPVVAFVHNAPSPDIVHARIVEAACNPAFAAMLAGELLPMLRERFHVTAEAAHTIIAGNSYTGLAAAHAALEYPTAFGGVMSTSGTHGWGYVNHPAARFLLGKDDEPEWLTRQYAASARKAIRFWIDVGSLEAGTFVPWMPGIDQRAANRHFRTVLQAKGV